jgi:ABC-type transport system substrate-binding protein
MRSTRATPDKTTPPRAMWAASIFALGPVGLLACGEGLAPPIAAEHGDDTPPRHGGTVRLAEIGDARNLDPAGPVDGVSLPAVHLIFAGLVDFDDHAAIAPDLAESWDVTHEGRAYRFVLRPGVSMHDGQELTAEDIKRSVERALHPSAPNPTASMFEGLVGFDDFVNGRAAHIEGVEVEGRYVVRFELNEPDAAFLPLLAMTPLRPVCKTGGWRYSDDWLPCGAGPFKLLPGGWQRGTSLHLVRHDSYFRPGLPFLDGVEWTFNMQALAQRFRFEAGDLDLVRSLGQADQRRFAGDPRWRPFAETDADTNVYGESMNTRTPPFDNIEIRRAVASAINREHYRLLKPAYMTVLTQLVPPDIPGYDPSVTGQHYDYDAALEHMRKAGYPYDPVTGRGGWPHPIDYPLYDQGLLVFTAQLLQQDLAKIGLHIELRLVSWQAFLTLQARPSGAPISQGSWDMDYPDPSSFFDPLFTTRAIDPEGGHNIAFYSNPRVDDLVAEARRESHEDRRRALYAQASAIVCDEAPWAFAYSHHWYRLRQPYVRGDAPHRVWHVDVTTTWLDRAGRSLEQVLGEGLR